MGVNILADLEPVVFGADSVMDVALVHHPVDLTILRRSSLDTRLG